MNTGNGGDGNGWLPSGKRLTNWKDPLFLQFLMGKLSISSGPFSNYVKFPEGKIWCHRELKHWKGQGDVFQSDPRHVLQQNAVA